MLSVKMEKALHLRVKENTKCVPMDNRVLCQKARGLCADFSKGSPETRDTRIASSRKDGERAAQI